jgi:acetate kinase
VTRSRQKRILTINTGSSSLKLALYEMGDQKEEALLALEINRIGAQTGSLQVVDGQGKHSANLQSPFPTQADALGAGFEWLRKHRLDEGIDAVGHRIVSGGALHSEPQMITPELFSSLRGLVPVDPDHMPQAISAIEAVSQTYPELPQVACFDSAFHRTMPRVAQQLGVPARYFDQGILRYGFHGISYEYIMWELRKFDPLLAQKRIVIAHLGHGASMAAIKGGKSLDTSMAFTPASGLVMGTRSGDLDPGILIYLLRQQGATVESVNRMLNQQSGLLGVSGLSGDMKDLLDQESVNPRAAQAIALFCYCARKYIAAYAGVLGGLDLVIFTGGIGENAAPVRGRICRDLEFLGIEIDANRNLTNGPMISRDGCRVQVRVMKTNENLMIARHAAGLLSQARKARGSV